MQFSNVYILSIYKYQMSGASYQVGVFKIRKAILTDAKLWNDCGYAQRDKQDKKWSSTKCFRHKA